MEHGSKADDLPDDAHVVRYVKPRKLIAECVRATHPTVAN